MYDTSNIARTAFAAATAALFAGACLTVAIAPVKASTVSMSVPIADLNLAHPAGRAVLDARIKSAARTICQSGGSTLSEKMSATRCEKAAIRNATAS